MRTSRLALLFAALCVVAVVPAGALGDDEGASTQHGLAAPHIEASPPKSVTVEQLAGFSVPVSCSRTCHVELYVVLEGRGAPWWDGTFATELVGTDPGTVTISLPAGVRERVKGLKENPDLKIVAIGSDAIGSGAQDPAYTQVELPKLDTRWIAKCVPLGPRTLSIGDVLRRGGFDVRVRCDGATELWVSSDLDRPEDLGIPGGRIQGVDASHHVRMRAAGTRTVFLRQPGYALRALRGARSASASIVVMGRIRGAAKYRSTPETVIIARFRRP